MFAGVPVSGGQVNRYAEQHGIQVQVPSQSDAHLAVAGGLQGLAVDGRGVS